MKPVFSFFIFFLFSFCIYADIYKVKIEKDDSFSRKIVGMLDIMGAGVDENGDIVLTVNSSESELSQLPLYVETVNVSGELHYEAEYSDLDAINERIDRVVDNSQGFAEVFVIGTSIEGREIKALRMTKSVDFEKDLPEILLVGTHHAREWISYEVPLSIAEFFVENIDSNVYVSEILDRSVLWFVPVLNPDGFVFSWDVNRYWRNNRRVHPDESIGVDLNRNYDASWIQVDYVHGTGPFSEPETLAMKHLIENSFEKPLKKGIKSLDGLITYHSYGQIMMYPPGSTEEPAEKSEYYKELAQNMSSLAFFECGSIYIVMQNSELYFTFGEMTEWFMKTHDGKPSFTIELRPHGDSKYDFVLPAEQITDTVRENISPAVYLIGHIISGETIINMDRNNNGRSDIIENTLYDYECDRSDLELPDSGDFYSDADSEKNDEYVDDFDNDESVADQQSEIDEEHDVDAVTSATARSGCALIILGD